MRTLTDKWVKWRLTGLRTLQDCIGTLTRNSGIRPLHMQKPAKPLAPRTCSGTLVEPADRSWGLDSLNAEN